MVFHVIVLKNKQLMTLRIVYMLNHMRVQVQQLISV